MTTYWLATGAALLVASAVALGLARRRFAVVTVVGQSMEPTLRAGDRVLVRRGGADSLRVGAIVVFQEPPGSGSRPRAFTSLSRERWAIKRVSALPGGPVPDSVRSVVGGTAIVPQRMLVLLGDGARSGDSRQWGFVPIDLVLGLVVRKLGP